MTPFECHRNRRQFLQAASLALGSLLWPIRGRAAERDWTAIQNLIDGYVAAGKMAGASVAVSMGGAPITYLSAGTIALDSAKRLDENSICRVHSMTKPVTGIAVMRLVEDGKLSLEQPVAEILPEWRVMRVAHDRTKSLESRPAKKVMTVRHLLTHTSGLGDWAPSAGSDPLTVAYRERGITPGNRGVRLKRPGYGPQARDLVEMVQRVAELPLVAEPGSGFLYSTVGYGALGLVIERVSGSPLDKFCHERIFAPLGMTSSGFRVPRDQLTRLTTNYDLTPAGLSVTDAAETSAWLEQPTLLDGGGGVVSTSRDFAQFSAMILDDGRLGDVRVLRPETARLARSNLMPAGLLQSSGHGYGAGMRVTVAAQTAKPFQSAATVSHGGASGCLWFADPARKGTLVFMTQVMPPTREISAALLEAVEADVG